MKTKITIISTVTIVLSIVVFILYSIKKTNSLLSSSTNYYNEEACYKTLDYKKRFFSYENMLFYRSSLVNFLLNKKNEVDFVKSFHVEDITLSDLELNDYVDDDLFRVFAKFTIVDSWSKDWIEDYPSTEDKVLDILQNCTLYDCGQVRISNTFDSFLFMLKSETGPKSFSSCDKDVFLCRELYLVNLCEDTITSISIPFSYAKLVGGIERTYTTISSNNTFSCHFEQWQEDYSLKERDAQIEFSFDEKGRIKLE